jgi:cytochrome c oxidase subunit II
LHFAQPQSTIAVVFGVLALALAGTFAVVARQTRRDVPFEVVREHGYRIRRFWLALLVVLGLVVIGVSTFYLPYGRQSGPATLVTVTAGQFYWSAAPAQVPAGTLVRFDVTSSDVNHGLGLYDPNGQLLGEVQAMPGYHNQLDITLKTRGDYLFGCLELCGIGHARMLRVFKVT